jgi:RNA polymerase sigma factor (TIGR02999 family)
MSERPQVTTLLDAMGRGEAAAQRELYELAYHELKRIARSTLKKVGSGVTMNPSTLVHEAYLKLAGDMGRKFEGSHHFYSLLARAMRQVIIDFSREQMAVKRGVGLVRTQLTEGLAEGGMPLEELLSVDDALRKLEAVDPELAELVEWHFFAGLSFVEIAEVRGVTERTVRRHWDTARAFLLDALPEAGAAAP